MINTLRDFVESLPVLLQWVGVMLAGAIPFVESELASVIGIIAGIVPPIAIAAAVIGNIAAVWLLIGITDRVRGRVIKREAPRSPRRERFRRVFDRYGVAGVSLLGPFILPSHITSVGMVGFGASKKAVLGWQAIAITLWGVLFGGLAVAGVNLAGI